MNTTATPLLAVLSVGALCVGSLAVGAGAQETKQERAPAAALPEVRADAWSHGVGRGPSYRAALARAIEDAVARSRGADAVQDPSIQSRLAVIASHEAGSQSGWFDGEGDLERAWVQRQIAGFVRDHVVNERSKPEERLWQVNVRALVAGAGRAKAQLVIELADNDLRIWQLERYEEGGPGRAFDQRKGRFEGPQIGDYLRRSGAVKIVDVAARAQPVASHRVVIRWQPLVVKSQVAKPNKARPTRRARPEFMSSGAVEVAVKVEDLSNDEVLLDERFAVPADRPGDWSADRLDAFITNLVDKAKAEVAKKVFFTLRPPVVLRKWAGGGGAWLVEARISKRVAAAFRKFTVGNRGSLATPDWQDLAAATFVGGSSDTCTFRLEATVDPSRIEIGASEVRPIR